MKNEEIHDKFDKKEIRDFLSKELKKANYSGQGSVDILEDEIKRLNEQLVRAKQGAAIRFLIEVQGWEMFDVSEKVCYDGERYFYFIGTEEEYEKLIDDIDTEK